MYFNLLRTIFSDLYRDHSPLSTDLKYDNAVRALAAQHLLHLGDICKFKYRHPEIIDGEKQLSKKPINQEHSWNFYTRAKTVYPFEGRIYNSFAALSQKENDMLATVYFLMRALACSMPHEASKEFLIDYFEELRMKYVELINDKRDK